ncbi:MAG: hypothetical protein IJ038_06320 [Clostridia bacterium]|nr:hypothetical protein [Clostridia bacterium]
MKPYMEALIANDSLRQRLCGDILGGRFSHAYIIDGVKGSGKHTIAYLAAAALACEKKDDTDAPLPCMKCQACKKILNKLSPDVITIGCDGRATMGIDSIRFLKEDVFLVPNELDNKIYIIEDADKMTPQAQNAFLLTLEEPPSYTGFILLCEDALSLLETIRSRAPVLRAEPIPVELIDEYIRKTDRRASQMKETSPSDYAELLMSAENGIGRALELLDPKALSPILTQRKLVKDFVKTAVDRNSHAEALALLSRFSSKRDGLAKELSQINTALRDLIVIKKSENAPLCFYESRDTALELCEKASIGRLMKLMSALSEAIDKIARNANVRLTLISLLSESDMI